MSLSSFFRDYVYIPLGGNRQHFVRNLLIVWMLTGFWHGASYNFIVWGLYYGIFLLLERTVLSNIIKKLPAFVSHIYLMLIVTIGWVFFYFIDLAEGLQFIKILFGLNGNALYDIKFEVEFFNNIVFLIFAILASTPLFKNMFSKLSEQLNARDKSLYVLQTLFNAAILIITTIMLVGQTYNPFLYFRF